MTIDALLARLANAAVQVRRHGGELEIRADDDALDDALIALLRRHKPTLLERLGDGADWWPQAPAITPAMLPLVTLTQQEIDRIVARVPGGGANVQDIYPLAPLQEGILFHHLLAQEGDPYLLTQMMRFDHRARLDGYLAALQAVIGRHDILRTAIAWEGLPQPVQVVLREAALPVTEVALAADGGDAVEQLRRRYDSSRYRIDLRSAPLMRVLLCRDPVEGGWLLLTLFHHLAGDHTTMEVMRHEIEAHLLGQAAALPAPAPFRNFIAHARLGVSEQEHEAFFRAMLAQVDQPTAPFGQATVRGDGAQVEEGHLMLAEQLSARLRQRARALGVSAASVCHLAWALVLARLADATEVVFGTVLFGRMQGGDGADQVMGLLINTLPVRIALDGQPVEASVRRTHALLAQLMRHEHAPLALAQRCSGVAAPTPLFSALFNYRHSAGVVAPPSARQQQAWQGVQWVDTKERTNYPVSLSVDDLGQLFCLTAQVDASGGAAQVCALMEAALQRLLDALEHTPQAPVGGLDVLPAAERERVLVEWNRSARPFPLAHGYAALFARQAALTPERVAASCGDEQLSYRELDERASRIAAALIAAGVGRDDLVPLVAERGLALLAMMVAVFKAGAAMLPLDVRQPAERLREVLRASGATLVLASRGQGGLLDQLLGGWPQAPSALLAETLWLAGPAPALAPLGAPDDLAYVIFTSGSTGKPKGAMVEQRGMINNIYGKLDELAIGAGDRLAQTASPAFDICVWQFLSALLVGGVTDIVPDAVAHDPAALLAAVEARGVTLLQIVPSMMRAMLDLAPGGALTALRCVLPTGEALPLKLAQDWFARFPDIPLMNVYGPAECADDVSYHLLTARPGDGEAIPIGRPTPNTHLYLVDQQLRPVPVGVAGEICVGGAGVGRGYLRDPELTRAAFVDHPFVPGARFYRTGDLGRYRADGVIEFIGRRDFQVKIRGFRIELGEIEARLARCAGVHEAAVLAREDQPGDQRLVAYYVAVDGAAPEAAALRAELGAQLPDYMVPSAYVALAALPLTPNGKLDLKALPAPDAGAYASRSYEAPQEGPEQLVATLWAQLLRRGQIGRHDNFFALGGHSLLAVQLISRLRTQTGLEVGLAELFARPVLADFAAGQAGAARSTRTRCRRRLAGM